MEIFAIIIAIIIALCAALANIATAVNFFFAKRQSENSDAMIKEMKAQAALSEKTIDQMKEQAALLENTVNADHKRSRLMLSIELFREWNRSVSPEVSAATRLIELLDEPKCINIANSSSPPVEDMKLSEGADWLYLVETCLVRDSSEPPFFKKEDAGRKIIITAAGVKQLRHLGVKYLNELEAVLSAWKGGVGDQAYLESEFSFLDKDISRIMGTFRRQLVLKGATFEAIKEFRNRGNKGAQLETTVSKDLGT